jgi:hypothetical protein
MLSYASGASAVPLLGETIGQNLRRTMERSPDAEALVVRSQAYRASYRELWDATSLLARALIGSGIEPGDRVGIWSPNRHEWVVTQYATARVGAILVNVNPAYKSSELRYALQQSGVRLLLLARAFRATDYVTLLNEVRHECADLRESLVLEDDWEMLLARAERVGDGDLATCEAALQFDDAINIQYTSGTTGFPKGATLTHHNILNNGFFIGEALGYSPADRVCIPVPFYHCFGMVLGNLACTTHGACMVIPGEAFDLAHRDHGGGALPRRDDVEGPVADAHARSDDLLRHDRDVARLDAEPARRSAREARLNRRACTPLRRDQGHRCGKRGHRDARDDGGALHARLQRDGRILEQRGGDERSDRPERLDAHRRSGHHGP